LLVTQANIGFLKGGPGAVNFGKGVLNRTDWGDGCYVQRHRHEVGMRLVEVAGVACNSRHPVLDVF